MGRLGDLQHKYGLAERNCRAIGLEFPIDGRSLGELVEEARASLDRIVDEGGPWLAGADWRPWAAEAPDVMLVDPDHALGVVVGDALNRRGIKVHHEIDALIALDDLVGRSGKPLPRVVLMELDQRGIDGMAFLRQLRDAGTLHRTKVVVLSARASESDLRMAFELGAADFVGKPFSTPLLVHRLSRVLER
jgi:CheY-like chemotaxis protein